MTTLHVSARTGNVHVPLLSQEYAPNKYSCGGRAVSTKLLDFRRADKDKKSQSIIYAAIVHTYVVMG